MLGRQTENSRGFFILSFFSTIYNPNNTPKPYKINGYSPSTKKLVVSNSIKIRRKRRKTSLSNPKKDRSAKTAELSFFKTVAFSHTDQLSQLDPCRLPPLGSGKQGLLSSSSGFWGSESINSLKPPRGANIAYTAQ